MAQDSGLDSSAMMQALDEGRYSRRLMDARNDALRLGISAVPTFIIDEQDTVVGARSIERFRERLTSIQAE